MKKISFIKVLVAVLGVLLVGMGVAFNASSALGNDPVGIVYDGVRSIANFSDRQLGMASNIVNVSLLILVYLTGKQYVNIGTFIYILPYGLAVDLGGKIYETLFYGMTQTLGIHILGAVLGCILLYTGVAMLITANIGLDPITGIVMVLKDKLKLEFRLVKMGFDMSCIILGFVLGGKLGIITVITAFLAGPVIQFIAGVLRKRLRFQNEEEKRYEQKL